MGNKSISQSGFSELQDVILNGYLISYCAVLTKLHDCSDGKYVLSAGTEFVLLNGKEYRPITIV